MADFEMDYAQALAEVKRRVAQSRSSFTAGMSVLPPARRAAMYGLYAFCRAVDDIADDGANDAERRQGLNDWRQRIAALFKGRISDEITHVLTPAVTAFHLVEADFQAIIDGMEMDAGEPIVAPDRTKLDLYCDRVASAVGRVSVRIFGDGSMKAMEVAHHLGRALQLTNILRDIAEDAARGRLYLPQELLVKHGIKSRDPLTVLRDPALPSLARELATQAAQHFTQADAAMKQCDQAAMRPARIMQAYYGAIFQALVKADWQHPEQRVTLPKWRKALLALRFMMTRMTGMGEPNGDPNKSSSSPLEGEAGRGVTQETNSGIAASPLQLPPSASAASQLRRDPESGPRRSLGEGGQEGESAAVKQIEGLSNRKGTKA